VISKLALLVVALLLLAGAVAKWRKPDPPRGTKIERARKCADCGAYMIGSGPCTCAEDRNN